MTFQASGPSIATFNKLTMPAEGFERGDMAAQYRLQILVGDEPCPNQAVMAEN